MDIQTNLFPFFSCAIKKAGEFNISLLYTCGFAKQERNARASGTIATDKQRSSLLSSSTSAAAVGRQ